MGKIYSPELKYVIDEALDSSEYLQRELNTVHLLLAMFMLDNTGRLLLNDLGYNSKRILPFVDKTADEDETFVEELMDFAEETASNYRNPEVNCLHLVVAMCRHRRTLGYNVLQKSGVSIPNLRNKAVSMLAGDMPKKYKSLFIKHQKNKAKISTPSIPPPRTMSKPDYVPTMQAKTTQSITTEYPTHIENRPAITPNTDFSQFPILSSVAIDLVNAVIEGEIAPIEGREAETDELLDILNKRKTNNPLIIGKPGVGKTALIEGLAFRMATDPESLPGLEGKHIFQLDPTRLLQGTELRGSFSERIEGLKREVKVAQGRVILFMDEIHSLAKGSVDGSQEIAQELKTSLARGEFPCIGATTTEEYKKTIERDPALNRRFHIIELDEPDETTTIHILASEADIYEKHHGVSFEPKALLLAVKLTNRYMHNRCQPDKALSVLDLAGSRARRAHSDTVTERIVAEAVAATTNVPLEQLVVDEAERYLSLETNLEKGIIGHKNVLSRIAEALRRNAAGFGGERPMGSFLFVGPTGVGKTEIARVLARELFDSRDSLFRLDMSEFSEAHSVAKLIGSPPGYVGFQEGGVLTGSVSRKPFQILLFDEIEKAHPNVHQLLLQVLDDGRLTDNLGNTADFTHTVIIMTSNLGAQAYEKRNGGIGFSAKQSIDSIHKSQVLAAVKESFAPELYNRIDEKIIFSRLERDEVEAVAKLLLKTSAKRLLHEKEILLTFSKNVPGALCDGGGFDPQYGARPMRRAIQAMIEGPLASSILKGEIRSGQKVKVSVKGKGFTFSVIDK